ncbi:MAG: DNA-protecting protein DprA [Actinobacteria bacterium]|nr:DNA-protecting protein DprA [Actinomycetota bacterium]
MGPCLVDEKAELVALCSLPGITRRQVGELLTLFGSPEGAWDAVRGGHSSSVSPKDRSGLWRSYSLDINPEGYIEVLEAGGILTLVRGERGYPGLLEEINDPPWSIFYRGKPPDQGIECVAVVGSRKATQYGIEAAEWIARGLARAGVCVVSGAAYGIDSAAHRGALAVGGATTAVLGCGPDVVYPRSNGGLLSDIAEKGCILSEYPPRVRPLRYHFPARNRLIAGMSLGVVVVEASRTGGALLTADFALSEGREVFAVPGHVFSKNSEGTNALIRNGASLVGSVEDILEELDLAGQETLPLEIPSERLTVEEQKSLDALEAGPCDAVEIAGHAGLSVGEALSLLSRMEVMGMVRRGPGGRYHVTSQSTRK